jgi:hypothetical protein
MGLELVVAACQVGDLHVLRMRRGTIHLLLVLPKNVVVAEHEHKMHFVTAILCINDADCDLPHHAVSDFLDQYLFRPVYWPFSFQL